MATIMLPWSRDKNVGTWQPIDTTAGALQLPPLAYLPPSLLICPLCTMALLGEGDSGGTGVNCPFPRASISTPALLMPPPP